MSGFTPFNPVGSGLVPDFDLTRPGLDGTGPAVADGAQDPHLGGVQDADEEPGISGGVVGKVPGHVGEVPDLRQVFGGGRRALRALVTLRRLTLRELVERDSIAVLTRSMTGYVLSADRRVTYRVMIAIITACEVPPDAAAEWKAAWRRLAAPEIEAREAARLEGLRASQGGRLYRMGRRSW